MGKRSADSEKKESAIQGETARAVGAGKLAALESVDFSDPNRPKTCLEVDFPIIPINKIATIEGKGSGALKPIYQVSKWWARRRSTVFRSILISAATKAPEDPAHAAKIVWNNYYANHQKKGAFKNIKVADIFMGGGTTLVEGSRLGMEMHGNDLNPVAWFAVKQELAVVPVDELTRLLGDVENEVRSQIIPFYYCDGPNGEKGKWIDIKTGKVQGTEFNPLSMTQAQRRNYKYEGPEIVYTFWSKHGPCNVTGCGHRTPIMTSPVMATKSVSVKYWESACNKCKKKFHVEDKLVRIAPDVPIYLAPGECLYTTVHPKRGVICPHCGHAELVKLGKSKNKTVQIALLVHPEWLAGSPKKDINGVCFGGSAQDDVETTTRWNQERSSKIRLLEVRGELPDTVTCPATKTTFKVGKDGGTVPRRSNYTCGACGTVQDVLDTVKATGKTGPMAAYAAQGYSAAADADGTALGGKFFLPFGTELATQMDAAHREWIARKDDDLAPYWPRSEVPYGFMTGMANGDIRTGHGLTHWWTMFNPRQLLVHAQLLKAIVTVGTYSWATREALLAAFQQYLRNQNMFCFWNLQRALEPMFSNNNFHPKMNVVENSCFSGIARGDFRACCDKAIEAQLWAKEPWEIACVGDEKHSEKVKTNDVLQSDRIQTHCGSSTELSTIESQSFDLIVTDPPFGGLLHYSELSDFFHVWLRLVLKDKYPEAFGAELTPKALEVVANRAREPENADAFYQRLLTQCWKEGYRILKPGGILAFTFHHSEDDPWVSVLESLFDAGFYLEATYPIRSDETKGEGEFGSKTIEFDILHVCRKRTEDPKPVSWGRMRREVLDDVQQIQGLLSMHADEGLPPADRQVIRRGKALEYFSRHYGKVFVDDGRTLSVKEAILGINQLLEEDAGPKGDQPPHNAEPFTRQFLRMFNGVAEQPRDQIQKYLRGTGVTPEEFEQKGWCLQDKKIVRPVPPLEIAQAWQGKHRRNMTTDFDQAMFLIGACFDGSGINAAETLRNDNFKAHPALESLLDWYVRRGTSPEIKSAATRAGTILRSWLSSQQAKTVKQMSLFEEG